MNIDRHNYEEYFILYMDNELSSDERRMVDAFVQLHPDLKEELDLLLQYKLTPDTSITFQGKDELLKENGEALIATGNHEEWLVLYIDNELTPAQKVKVEQYIATNPEAAATLSLLQKTKLEPEQILFTDKQSLYRKEERVRRIPVLWHRLRQAYGDRRWRVAAVLLLAATVTGVIISNKGAADNGEVAIVPSKDPATIKSTNPATNNEQQEKTATAVNNNSTAPEEATTDVKNKITTPVYKQPIVASTNGVEKKNNTTVKKEDIISPQVIKNEPVIAEVNKKQDNNLPKPIDNPFVTKKEDNTIIAKKETPAKNNDSNNPLTKTDVTTQSADPSDYILASNDGKKNKSRGLFRKIARTFEKRTNIDPTDDEGRLLVAGFSIKTKKP
jgi:hypothetical protein